MRVQRAYQTDVDLTDRQVTACKQHAGAARWAYNWGLRVKQERYKVTKTSPTAIELDRDLNAAINLEKLVGSLSDSLNACGVAGSGAKRNPRVQLAAVQQELNTTSGLSRSG